MIKRKGNKKQMTLSQSLFRSKAIKKESSNNKTILNIIECDNSTGSNCSQNDQDLEDSKGVKGRSSSQPESIDCDDSFDLFLPRKYQPKAPSSQSSFFEVKKGSRYFNESGELRVPKVIKDDDLDLALAVSLQESKGTTVSLKPPKTECIQPRGKLKQACSKSLLMRRTPEERERIVTEKVAIVLMDKGKDVNSSGPSNHVNESFPLCSAHLKKQLYEMKTLWALAQTDLSQVKLENFFIDVIIHYLPSNCLDDDECFSPADDASRKKPLNEGLQNSYSSEDIFGESSGEDADQIPYPKRFRPSQSMEGLDKPEVVISPNRFSNKSGEEQLSLKVESLDLLSLKVEESDASEIVKNGTGSHSPTCEVDESRVVNRKPSDVLKHYLKLSTDMRSVSNSGVSQVIEVTNGSKTFFAHHCIFQVRCPALLENLETNPRCLTDYSSEVCEALFGYIYSADIASCLNLNLEQKKDLMECGKKFNIACLVEELEADIESSKERVKLGFSHASEFHQLNVSFPYSDCVPDNVGTCDKAHSTPKGMIFTKPQPLFKSEVRSNQVVVLDSDSCSVEEIMNSEGPVSECAVTEDEDLDNYLKDGKSLTEKKNSDDDVRLFHQNIESSDEACVTPCKGVSAPEKSIDQYFQDSFPSLADISVTFSPQPPIAPKGNETPEPIPGSSKPRGIVDCVTPGGQLVVSDRATPLPDYNTMLSPELKAALQKYGIRRGIGRQKAVTLLRYIYDQIHPPADHPAVAKAISDVKNTAQKRNDAPVESDDDVYSLSSESSGDVQMFEDLGDVASSQPSTLECDRSRSLQRDVGGYIKSNTLLYAAILSYEPIWLNKFHKAIKDHGIKCNKKEIMDVLDELGITFRTEKSEKQMQKKGLRRKPRKKH